MESLNLAEFIGEQKAFSLTAFGPGTRRIGVANHLLEECLETEAKPDDLSEWVDLMLLSLDSSWRSGFHPKDIAELLATGVEGHDLVKALASNMSMVPTVTILGDAGIPLTETETALYWIRCRAGRMKLGEAPSLAGIALMFFAACDGAQANGFSPTAIAKGLKAKLAKNKARTWPDWRTMSEDDAINHQA